MLFLVKPLSSELFKVKDEFASATVAQLLVITVIKLETDRQSNIVIEADSAKFLLDKTPAKIFQHIFS